PPRSALFPYTTLFRSEEVHRALVQIVLSGGGLQEVTAEVASLLEVAVAACDADGRVVASSGSAEQLDALTRAGAPPQEGFASGADRKSTRLNSSHVAI